MPFDPEILPLGVYSTEKCVRGPQKTCMLTQEGRDMGIYVYV